MRGCAVSVLMTRQSLEQPAPSQVLPCSEQRVGLETSSWPSISNQLMFQAALFPFLSEKGDLPVVETT